MLQTELASKYFFDRQNILLIPKRLQNVSCPKVLKKVTKRLRYIVNTQNKIFTQKKEIELKHINHNNLK